MTECTLYPPPTLRFLIFNNIWVDVHVCTLCTYSTTTLIPANKIFKTNMVWKRQRGCQRSDLQNSLMLPLLCVVILYCNMNLSQDKNLSSKIKTFGRASDGHPRLKWLWVGKSVKKYFWHRLHPHPCLECAEFKNGVAFSMATACIPPIKYLPLRGAYI